MDERELQELIERVRRELESQGLLPPGGNPEPLFLSLPEDGDLAIDQGEGSPRSGLDAPADPEGLQALLNTTSARIGAGRAGARYRTRALLEFQADLAVTQDTLYRSVDPQLLDRLGLWQVNSEVNGGREEYLLRPDLGRRLSGDGRRKLRERCTPAPQVQVAVGDGLSAEAVEANLPAILPVLENGCRGLGLSYGVPFFINNCRVGIMNDIGDELHPEVVILLIGERPGLGRARSLSAYLGYRPKSGDTDAERDVICNIFDPGGTNPLEAGAFALQLAQRMLARQASGVRLRQLEHP